MSRANPITVNGVEYSSLKSAAIALGFPYHTVYARHIKYGWTIERTFSDVVRDTGRGDDPETRKAKAVARNKAWRAANPDKLKAAKIRYREQNDDKVREANKRWRLENADKLAVYNEKKREAYRAAHPPRVRLTPEQKKANQRAKVKQWQEANPERVKELMARWRRENPDKVKAHTKAFEARNPEDVYRVKSARWRADNPLKYAARLVCNGMDGLVIADIPPPLAEMKLEQLEVMRLSKKVKHQIKELENETSRNDACNG